MTRNDFIHHAAIALYSRDSSDENIIAKYAGILANEVSKIAPFDEEIVQAQHLHINLDDMTEEEREKMLKEIRAHKINETTDGIIGMPLKFK
jgi:hypothetical protein